MTSKRKILREIHKLVDLFLTSAAFIGAYFLKKYYVPSDMRGLIETPDYYLALLLIGIIWTAGFNLSDLHKLYIRQPFSKSFMRLFRVLSINTVILAMAFYFLKIQDVSRLLIAIFFLIDLALLTLSAHLLVEWRKMGMISKVLVVIIGSREAAKDLIESILQDPDSHYEVLGCLEISKEDIGKTVTSNVKIIGTLSELQYCLSHMVVDELVFAAPIEKIWEAEQHMAIAEAVGVQVRILPHWHLRKFLAVRPKFYTIFPDLFFGNPTLVLRPTSATQGALMVKTVFDYIAASALLISLLPIFIVITCAIKIISPGPIFYRQQRCALYGRMFTLYKFRTMVVGARAMQQDLISRNEANGLAFKIQNDPRIIPYIGRILRKYSLDELPNLFNVLLGDMSIIGPRPAVPDEVARYELWERRRLSMKPGLTCLWQVSPCRNSIPFKQWMEMDLEYIDNWSLKLDLSILVKTARAVFFGYGM